MKRLLVIVISLITISFYGQDTINRVDVNGKRYGYWRTSERNPTEYYDISRNNWYLVGEGKYSDGKKIGLWYYEIDIRFDTSIHECQQLYSYLAKTEFYENDGAV